MAGVLGRGLPVGVVLAVVVQMITGSPLPDSLLTARFGLTTLAAVALFSLSGCIRADARWRMAERRFGG
ncbi:MAG: hypothetical protein ABFS46_19275 [Myxococcota bacterium]